ncbi:hypothetical protein HS088_TW05G00339 [Tripterygium wilfordii]|uniref:Alpha 1,4-glycosyltransferase domain-containing protein n=1 Tax=Tripterygium wilfordii TaxID=458696 RepID=A0A7J7DN20_TRIWF|nr:hypothetical protein HS088_TW05G00339 [Tripterygium wilfordii]
MSGVNIEDFVTDEGAIVEGDNVTDFSDDGDDEFDVDELAIVDEDDLYSLPSENEDDEEKPAYLNPRLAVLYKYGGVYLDADFIVLKSFKGLRNSIGAQSIDVMSNNWTRLNNAVLVFDMNHPLLLKFIQQFASTFDGNKWGHNGPYLVSRVVQRVEGLPGFNFTVLPPMAFYPDDWNRIGGLFRNPKNEAIS